MPSIAPTLLDSRKHRPEAGTLPVMAAPDDLETRVAALENEVRELADRYATASRTRPRPACWLAARTAT